jgi:hypothetical protein
MNLTGTEVRVGMTATANVSSVNTVGSVTIGSPVAALVYQDAPNVAYSLRMDIASGETLTLDMTTGAVTGVDPGVLQVETATVVAAAGITTAGDATVIVTAANLTGSPLTVSVPLLLTDTTTTLVATKIRAALTASIPPSIFTIGGTGADITLTAVKAIANDTALNVSIANGTCAGITAAPTSTNTTAGVIATQAYRIQGTVWDQTDFEGEPLPTMTKVHAINISCKEKDIPNSFLEIGYTAFSDVTKFYKPFNMLEFSPNGDHPSTGDTISFLSSDGDASFTIDIHAGT